MVLIQQNDPNTNKINVIDVAQEYEHGYIGVESLLGVFLI